MATFRVYTTREADMAGAGLGRAEMYGDDATDFATREEAEAQAARFDATCSDDLKGTYRVRRLDPWEEGM